ncbi:MAG: type II secretion system protein [Candidatus Paceibacterota bacterium]
MHFILHTNRGFTIIEVLIACAIISVTSFALISTAQKGIQLSNQALRQVQAGLLIEEGVEAVKTIRDNGWSTISGFALNTIYYPSFNTSTNTWSLGTTNPGILDSVFTRTVVFSEVNRDSNDDIVSSGTVDARTKKVTVEVSWPSSGGSTSKAITFYIADIFT